MSSRGAGGRGALTSSIEGIPKRKQRCHAQHASLRTLSTSNGSRCYDGFVQLSELRGARGGQNPLQAAQISSSGLNRRQL